MDGAPGESRTPTSSRITDFESAASTNSATGACEAYHSDTASSVNRKIRTIAESALFRLSVLSQNSFEQTPSWQDF